MIYLLIITIVVSAIVLLIAYINYSKDTLDRKAQEMKRRKHDQWKAARERRILK